MVAACISIGYRSRLYIWEQETPSERTANDKELAEENKQKKESMMERRTRARVPGTEEYHILQQHSTVQCNQAI